MGIDKHIILTLQRSGHRQSAMLGACAAMQTPPEKIFFAIGHDNKDYDDDGDLIAEMAADDGFPYAHQFNLGLEGEFLAQSPSGVCQVWNFSRVLRWIAESNETCLVTWDDRILTIPFTWADTITWQLQDRSEEFYLWQLRIRFGDLNYTDNLRVCTLHPELVGDAQAYLDIVDTDRGMFETSLNTKWVSDFRDFQNNQYRNPEILTTPSIYIQRYLQKNRLGYDESMVISPAGATWFLQQAMDMEILDPADDPANDPAIETPHWENYIYRRNTFDSWMIGDIDDAVAAAIADNKGIYCPREIGYRFVHDWLPMGSDIDWANKDNAATEEVRTNNTEINFLDL